MTVRYLARAASAAAAPNPLMLAALTVVVPLAVILIGWALLDTIAIDNSTGRAVSYSAVRTAITQVLDKDLAADRVQEVLTELPDLPPKAADATTKPDAAAGEKRASARAAKLKTIAARLNGERARLTERVVALALSSHPSLDSSITGNLIADERRKKMAEIVRQRLEAKKVRTEASLWVSDVLDSRSLAGVESTVGATKDATSRDVVAQAVAASLSGDELVRSASAAVALAFNPFDTRPGESAWTTDVSARLSWAIVTLLFILTFGIVAFSSAVQIWRIESNDQKAFWGVTLFATLVGSILTQQALSPSHGSTPLHLAFQKYVEVFDVEGILLWADINNLLRGAGMVLLIAGSLATFSVKVSSVEELNEQLRGFKALFNAGAVFLLAGTFEVFAGFRWPVVFAADDATRTALQAAASAFSAAVGAGFAVVLLATYLVTTAVLRQQAIAHGVKATEADAALETFGFGDLTSQQFMRFAQALAPLLPGVFQLVVT